MSASDTAVNEEEMVEDWPGARLPTACGAPPLTAESVTAMLETSSSPLLVTV